MARKRGVIAGGIAALALVGGVGVASAGGAQRGAVVIGVGNDEASWDTPTVTIAAGDSVTWEWADTAMPHNVHSASSNWNLTTEIVYSQSTTATFSAPGTYWLRAQVNDSSGNGGGGDQCCWTSAHIVVNVK